nr:phage tail tube protein [Heyndrickxia oleronia]
MDGRWLTNFNSAEAMGELDKEEIKRAGTRIVGHKVVGITWSGTLKGLKVTSELTELISQVADDTKSPFCN